VLCRFVHPPIALHCTRHLAPSLSHSHAVAFGCPAPWTKRQTQRAVSHARDPIWLSLVTATPQ